MQLSSHPIGIIFLRMMVKTCSYFCKSMYVSSNIVSILGEKFVCRDFSCLSVPVVQMRPCNCCCYLRLVFTCNLLLPANTVLLHDLQRAHWLPLPFVHYFGRKCSAFDRMYGRIRCVHIEFSPASFLWREWDSCVTEEGPIAPKIFLFVWLDNEPKQSTSERP